MIYSQALRVTWAVVRVTWSEESPVGEPVAQRSPFEHSEESKPSRRHAPPLLPRPLGFARGDMSGTQGDME